MVSLRRLTSHAYGRNIRSAVAGRPQRRLNRPFNLSSTIPQSGSIAASARHFYEFGPFRLDVLNSQLLRDGQPLPLTPKDIDMLLLLVRQQGRVLDKPELMSALWPDSFVEEANLSQHVFMLRKTLGAQANGKPYVETVPKRGYYFAAEVREVLEDAPAASASASNAHGAPPLPAGQDRPARHGLARAHRLVYATLLVGVFIGAVYVGTRGNGTLGTPPPNEAARPIRSIAVLPFKPLHEVQGDDYLGLGLADALITKLGNLRQIEVRPTGAVRRYTDFGQGAVAAGRELGVDAVLEGSFQRDGDKLRVTVQLVSVRDASPMWTQTFDTAWTDIFSVQDAISEQLARALALTLTAEEKQGLAKRHTTDPAAYDAYLKSRYFWNKRTAEGYKKAIEHANQAIARDPAYALAHAALADSYALLGSTPSDVLPRQEAMERARAAALRALALDDMLAEAHTSLAFVKMHYDWQWDEAELEFQRAIELDPGYATAHHWYAYCLVARRRYEASIAAIRRAHDLDPLSVIISSDVAEIYYFAGRYDDAIRQARQTLEMDPSFALARRVLGWSLQRQGKHDAAIEELQRAWSISELERASTGSSGNEFLLGALANAYATAGRHAEARKILRELRPRTGRQFGWDQEVLMVYAALGETSRALGMLERSQRERYGLILMAVDPRFDPLRGEQRFVDLLRRMGLPSSDRTHSAARQETKRRRRQPDSGELASKRQMRPPGGPR